MDRLSAENLCRCLLEFICSLTVDPHRGFELRTRAAMNEADGASELADLAVSLAHFIQGMDLTTAQRGVLEAQLAERDLPSLASLLDPQATAGGG